MRSRRAKPVASLQETIVFKSIHVRFATLALAGWLAVLLAWRPDREAGPAAAPVTPG